MFIEVHCHPRFRIEHDWTIKTLNTNSIVYISPHNAGGTVIYFLNDFGNIIVDESYEQLKKILMGE